MSEPLENWADEIERLLPEESRIEALFDRLWPICRSITGNGFRESLKILSEVFPFESFETKSGTPVLDWEVPNEWNIEEAFIEDERGMRVVDFRKNNLHVVGYSIPVDQWLTLEELEGHLHSIPDKPDAIPYITSYYREYWGFSLTHRQYERLQPGRYRAVIRSTLQPGSLTIGHRVIPAGSKSKKEILLSAYLCHPSLANNELSGPIVTAFLGKAIESLPNRRFNYRLVVAPETIGTITYLARYGEELKSRLHAGFVVTCVGDSSRITYKKSRREDTETDRCALRELAAYGKPHEIRDFFPTGSEERQYCSPGFNLPVGSLMRSSYNSYPEYHTSLDDRSFVSWPAIRESIGLYLRVILAIEFNRKYETLFPYGEPMLKRHGLQSMLGAPTNIAKLTERMMWLLNLSDGEHDLCAIASKANCSILDLQPIAELLVRKELLKMVE